MFYCRNTEIYYLAETRWKDYNEENMALTTSRSRLHPTQARRQTRTHTSAHTLKHACTGKLTHTRIGVNPGWVRGVTTPQFWVGGSWVFAGGSWMGRETCYGFLGGK